MVLKNLFDRLRGQGHRHGACFARELLKISEWFSTRHSFMFGQRGAVALGLSRERSDSCGDLKLFSPVVIFLAGGIEKAQRVWLAADHHCHSIIVEDWTNRLKPKKRNAQMTKIPNAQNKAHFFFLWAIRLRNWWVLSKRNLILDILFNWSIIS